MATPVSREELRHVPHLNMQAIGDRTINLMPLWDGEKWHSWVPAGDKVIRIQMAGVVEGDYLAKTAQLDSDLFITFVDLMWQRASWPEIVPLITAIEDDFRHMGTSLAKLKHIFRTRNVLPQGAPRAFAFTELEYLIILCRTVFDLLQDMMSRIWHHRVRLLDPVAERRRKGAKLRDTFSRMCLKDNNLRSVEELEQKFGLPRAMAEQYALAAPFFLELRELRNGIVHVGTELEHIFETERGFCIRKDSRLLKAIPCKFSHEYNEHLVSVLPLLSAVIVQTIGTCNSLVNAFAFVRGPSTSALSEVLKIHNGGSPWWGPPESAG